jgi:hypothetical protein
MFPAQEKFWHFVLEDYLENKPLFYIVYKIRQFGISTLTQVIIATLHYCHPNRRGVIVAHEETQSQWLYEMNKTYYMGLDEGDRKRKPLTSPNPKVKELVYRHPHNSRLMLATAKNLDAVRGKTLTDLHGSEIGYWPNAREFRAAADAACHYLPHNLKIWESTPPRQAVGNEFFKLWKAAESGKNNLTPVFLSFSDDWTFYSLPLQPKEQLYMTESQQEFYNEYKPPLETMKWIIRQLEELNGDWSIFHREYPYTPELGFLQSGTSWFDVNALREQERSNAFDPDYYLMEWKRKFPRLRSKNKKAQDSRETFFRPTGNRAMEKT